MSVEHLALVLHHSRAKGTAKLVLLGIANHQGDGGAWPSVNTLATYANVHPRNVQKAVESLVSKGELAVAVQAGGTRDTPDHRRANRYDVLVKCPSWCDRTPNHRDTRPTAEKALWINPLANTPPPGANATPPVADTPPPPLALAPPEPSPRTGPNQGGLSTTDRASYSWSSRPCAVCGRTEALCYLANEAVPQPERHTYESKRDRRASG